MVKAFFLILVIFCCNACVKTVHVSGHLFENDEMKSLQTAKSKHDIENLLGSPTSISDFGQETWYYITTKKETIAFLPDKIVEQNIVSISFNGDQVDTIDRYNEENANRPELVSEYTAIRGTEMTKAQQLLGNVGRFTGNKAPAPQTPRSGF